MDVEIRLARPEDASFLGWAIFAAGRSHCQRGVWDVILGRPEDECLAFLELLAATETPHMFHYACSIVAEVDGRPVAALSGYDPKELGLDKVGRAFLQVHEKLGLTVKTSGWTTRGVWPRLYTAIPTSLKARGLLRMWPHYQSSADGD